MMNRARMLLCGIDPGFDDFEDKQTVFIHHAGIGHFAFKIGEAFGNQRRGHACGGKRREAEFFEFIDRAARSISAGHNFFNQFNGGNVDHAFARLLQNVEGEVAIADDARQQRRLKIHHHVPGHGHHVRFSAARGADQHNGPRLQQAVNLGQRKRSLLHCCKLLWRTPGARLRTSYCSVGAVCTVILVVACLWACGRARSAFACGICDLQQCWH